MHAQASSDQTSTSAGKSGMIPCFKASKCFLAYSSPDCNRHFCVCRNWAQIHERRHVIVHLPSMALSEGQRQGIFKPQVRANSQMARLCDLADPLVDLLYIAPFKLPEVASLCRDWTTVAGLTGSVSVALAWTSFGTCVATAGHAGQCPLSHSPCSISAVTGGCFVP